MSTPVERLKETLDEFSDEHMMITVSRKDLEALIRSYENLKKELEKRSE
ncbi:hypothetical protein Exig_3058 (plasmid) [Exiguobacterium sibiricum 255-15]|uniref:Uncharacterized protein n=1 Tax=Exiguobacterium sibiricum (strain DSM 17290 / CCUG 55495 / CIP 109462 / JCM 13490 / 255-15) TaxID=262543 RepID=B1YMS6_EXIS2|nr:hypothetical protein [Exiguobacterium sibiricum]ACB62503.1 hypothetical protein Exig_3058 [Exiguobacterium sibiricum 255-15]